MHKKYGVEIRNLNNIKFISDSDGKVSKVDLGSGDEIPADLVIFGDENKLNDDMAKEAGLKIDEKLGGIKTNPFMQTSNSDIFAAGEIASYPDWFAGGNMRS